MSQYIRKTLVIDLPITQEKRAIPFVYVGEPALSRHSFYMTEYPVSISMVMYIVCAYFPEEGAAIAAGGWRFSYQYSRMDHLLRLVSEIVDHECFVSTFPQCTARSYMDTGSNMKLPLMQSNVYNWQNGTIYISCYDL